MDNIEYNVIISDAALSMLDSHMDFLAQVSKNAALRTMDEILSKIESLSNNPERFPAYDNSFISDNRYRRMLAAKRYLVLYEVSADTVYVDYIVDCRQDYEWLVL
jgi:plasmid stabilization system protein ParE